MDGKTGVIRGSVENEGVWNWDLVAESAGVFSLDLLDMEIMAVGAKNEREKGSTRIPLNHQSTQQAGPSGQGRKEGRKRATSIDNVVSSQVKSNQIKSRLHQASNTLKHRTRAEGAGRFALRYVALRFVT